MGPALALFVRLCFTISVIAGALIVTPQNQAAIAGHEVEMLCRTDGDKRLKWFILRPGSTNGDEIQIFNGYYTHADSLGLYTVTTSTDGNFALKFNASKETAQRYICFEPGSVKNKSAELTVLDPDLSCYLTSHDEYVNITCAIEFRGNWALVMEWKRCNNETIITSEISDSIKTNDRVSSTITIRQNGSNHESCYKVTTLFRESGKLQETSADNVPSYSRTFYFKYPDWNQTSDCSLAPVKWDDDSRPSAQNFTDEESYKPLELVIIIAIPMSGLVIIIVIVVIVKFICFYRRKKQKTLNTNGKLIPMSEMPNKDTGSCSSCLLPV